MSDLLEKIESFVEGKMSAEDAKKFQQMLSSDSELNKEYKDYLAVKEALESSVEQDLRQSFKKIDNEGDNVSMSGNPHRKWWVLASILAMVIVIGMTTFVRTSKIVPEQIASEFSIFDESDNFRSEGNDEKIEETDYYLPMEKANGLIQEKKYAEARSTIAGITLDNSIVNDNKEWMIALSYYLENGRKDQNFQNTLDSILKNPEHNCYNLAVNLDSKVNSFWGRLK